MINKLMMLSIVVKDMPKAKEFYVEKFALKIATEYRQDDDNWWVSLIAPEHGTIVTLAKAKGYEVGRVTLYFEASDLTVAHKELESKGVQVNEIKDDLFGPGSGVKWFNFKDPDGNLIHVAQKHEYTSSIPF